MKSSKKQNPFFLVPRYVEELVFGPEAMHA